jgi:hypothetical protein
MVGEGGAMGMFGRTAGKAVPAARLGAHIGHGVQRVVTDTGLGRARQFPRCAVDLTPEALSRIMGRRVDSVLVIDGDAGTSSRVRLALSGEDVPESVFVKLPAATAATRMLGELAGLGETEARFYRDLAPELKRGVPRSYGSAFDPLTGRFVVVLEDMTTTPCEFPDTLHPLDKDQMALLVEFFAHLHGTFWGRLPAKPGGRRQFGWLRPPSAEPSNLLTPALLRLSARRTSIPVEAGRFIWENYQAITATVDSGTHTVLHGDAHPGNTFFRNGQAGMFDWQVVRRGHPSRDIVHALVLGMSTADRQAVERELLDVYRHALAAEGGPELRRDELWLRYRQAVPYSFVAALSTLGLGGMQTEEIAAAGVRRTVAALEDLETEAAYRRSV